MIHEYVFFILVVIRQSHRYLWFRWRWIYLSANWQKENHQAEDSRGHRQAWQNSWITEDKETMEMTRRPRKLLPASRLQDSLIFNTHPWPEITFDFCLSPFSQAQTPKLESPEPLCSPGLLEHPVLATFLSSSTVKYPCPGSWTTCSPFRRLN